MHYFGDPIYTYTLKQAIEDGYLVPYLLEERITNVDEDGFTGPDGSATPRPTSNATSACRTAPGPSPRTSGRCSASTSLRDEKTIVFCVDDTHAAFMAQELRRLSGDNDYAARITRAERNCHQLERNFAEVGPEQSARRRHRRSADHRLRRAGRQEHRLRRGRCAAPSSTSR